MLCCNQSFLSLLAYLPQFATVDKNAAYPPAIEALQAAESLPKTTETWQSQNLNKLVEPEPSIYKRLVKGQSKGADKGDVIGQISFINRIFGVAA